MTNILDVEEKYHLVIHKIEKRKNYVVLYGKDHDYFLMDKNVSKEKIWEFFQKINYSYVLFPLSDSNDSYELYPYYEDIDEDFISKGEEIIDALSFLHRKSLSEEEVEENEVFEFYQMIRERITSLQEYYENFQNKIEEYSFPRVDYY